MNSKLKIIVTLSLTFVMIITGISPVTTAFAEDNYKHEDIHDFIQEGQSVISQETITDFAGNTFKLYELSPSGYAIYSFNENASIFIEGSYVTNSPYYGESGAKYYCGIGEYFIEPVTRSANANVRHLRTNESISKTNLTGAAFTVDAEHYIKPVQTRTVFPDTPDPSKTTTYNGFTVIKNYQYFTNLSHFPNNTDGTCGLVAICILLGYFNNKIDTNIITDTTFLAKDSSGNIIDGTTQEMHDYLFDNCMHAIFESDKYGYPMGAGKIKATVQDYLDYKCIEAVRNKIQHEYANVFYTHVKPRSHINSGTPTILVLVTYESQSLSRNSNKESFHDVVAYGYDSNDRYLTHFGWTPNSTTYTQMVIGNATINGYYTINYGVH